MDRPAETQDDIRATLAAAFDAAGRSDADEIRDPDTRLTHYPFCILRRSAIYRLEHYVNEAYYVALGTDGSLVWLTTMPENFVALARAEGVVIDNAGDATKYACAYLETTADLSELFYLVSSIDEISWFPNPNSDEFRRIERLRKELRATIAPPYAQAVGASFIVTLWAMREQTLERLVAIVDRTGDVSVETETIEARMPAVYSV